MASELPFRIGGVVIPPHFTDRAAEVTRVSRALRTPQDHLVVLGPRRMGKTSVLRAAQDVRRRVGQPVMLVDFSTASSLAEMTTRLLQTATKELGRRWSDVAMTFAERLQVRVTMEPDAASGAMLPSVALSAEGDEGAQRATLGNALDTIEALAAAKNKHLGIILDEFQEIAHFGGETAEAHLRGIIQHHRHVTYVLAGSDERIIQAMLGRNRPFYKLLTPVTIGAIEPGHMAQWIEERLSVAGLKPAGIGAAIVQAAGPRTRDIVQLAQSVAEVAPSRAKVTMTMVEEAYERIVHASDAPYRAMWNSLSPLQQQLMRLLTTRASGLTSASTRREFGITVASGSIVTGLGALVDRGVVVKRDARYEYDDPFMRGWVALNALADIGRSRSLLAGPE